MSASQRGCGAAAPWAGEAAVQQGQGSGVEVAYAQGQLGQADWEGDHGESQLPWEGFDGAAAEGRPA